MTSWVSTRSAEEPCLNIYNSVVVTTNQSLRVTFLLLLEGAVDIKREPPLEPILNVGVFRIPDVQDK